MVVNDKYKDECLQPLHARGLKQIANNSTIKQNKPPTFTCARVETACIILSYQKIHPPTFTCARVETQTVYKRENRVTPPTFTCARVETYDLMDQVLTMYILQPLHARGLKQRLIIPVVVMVRPPTFTCARVETDHTNLGRVHTEPPTFTCARVETLCYCSRHMHQRASNLYMRAG